LIFDHKVIDGAQNLSSSSLPFLFFLCWPIRELLNGQQSEKIEEEKKPAFSFFESSNSHIKKKEMRVGPRLKRMNAGPGNGELFASHLLFVCELANSRYAVTDSWSCPDKEKEKTPTLRGGFLSSLSMDRHTSSSYFSFIRTLPSGNRYAEDEILVRIKKKGTCVTA
jgi:hypothetical protein